jgi:hypothetical protein
MSDDLISVRDIATQHGKRKQSVFKILKRLGIETTKRRCSTGKNQFVVYVTQDQYRLVRDELLANASYDADSNDEEGGDGFVSAEVGVFYLIQLEPEGDPGRFKVGFAVSMPERLRHLKCSAPFTVVMKTWPCRRLWEKTAIDCVPRGCQQLHTEVFRAGSLEEIVKRCDQFFELMPPVNGP